MTTTAARPTTTGDPGYSETMPCEPESARRARLLVSAALDAWGIGELADAATLVVSELITNAINHTRCRVVCVRVQQKPDGVIRIGVADTSRDTPEMNRSGDDSEDGRGLALVAAASQRWGYDLHPWGKLVWAELRMPLTC
ncbi:ATP-binding protein [Streptomyces sp. NPDC020719]|uniref:ATP-binding protein n=1 Tax=unclassified Streptomyces TaxID=2593676 RepID=UPI0034113AE5